MTTEKQTPTTDKQETETTETKSKPFPKKALGMSLASVAVAVALGFGVAYANGVFTPKAAPTPPAVATQEATKEDKVELSQEAVAEATSELSYGGKDVSVTNPVSVSIKDGHVMVVETVNDSAANNVWYAPRRAAALAARIAETTVKGSSEDKSVDVVDVTYVIADTNSQVQIAVVDTPKAEAVEEAGKQTPLPEKNDQNADTKPAEEKKNDSKDASSEAKSNDSNKEEKPAPVVETTTDKVLNNSDGFVMSENTHAGLTEEEKGNVGTSGGVKVTDPEGTEIVPATPAPKPDDTTEPEKPATSEPTEAPSSSNSSSSSSSSNSSSAPSRERKPIYRTEQVWIVDQEAWTEQVWDHSEIVFTDGTVFTDSGAAWQYQKKTKLSYSTREVYKNVYHEEVGHWESRQVLDHYE